MEALLKGFLNSSDSQTKPPTHTLMDGGKFYVPKCKMTAFYKKILKMRFVNGQTIPPIVERMSENHPFIVDIDIKYKDKLSERQYTDETIEKLVTYLYAKLSDYLELADDSREVWVQEKDTVYPCKAKGFQTKDGIHFVFPHIIIDKALYKTIINLMQSEKVVEEIFAETCAIPPDNSENTLLDGAFTSWQPYGCSKANESPYTLTKVFAINEEYLPELCDEETFQDEYGNTPENNLRIAQQMSVVYREPSDIQTTEIFREEIEAKGLKISTQPNGNAMDTQNAQNAQNAPKPKKKHVYGKDKNLDKIMYRIEGEELKLVRALAKCLSKERSEDYEEWINAGLMFHNINEELLDAWKAFSAQSDSYNESECEKKWFSFRKNYSGAKRGMGSLVQMARKDNLELFLREKRNSLEGSVDESVKKGSDADYLVATAIYNYYKSEFISVDADDEWYHFNGTRWERTIKGVELKNLVHTEIYRVYEQYYPKYSKIAMENPDSEDAKKWMKNLFGIQMKLVKDSYVKSLMSSLRGLFHRKDIMEQFDSNLDLIGFENGVYDLKQHVFREGRPEDYITMTNKITLPVEKTELPIKLDDLVVKMTERIEDYEELREDMMDFLEKIIPNRNLREYTLRFISKCLSGENRDEGFYIWTGSGGNGKSKLVDLAMKCMGEYACNLPVSLLTQKRKASGAANPEMARTRGRRFAVMQEPDINETLNVGEMKEITGNDVIQARGLYKEPFEFIPQFKLLMMCNDLPNIPSNDDGTWRRLEAVPFKSRFVRPEQVDENQHKYLIDKELKHKLPEWKEVFMMILLKEWRQYDKHGIHIPEEVKERTNEYRNANDVVGQWISSDNCQEAPNEMSTDGITEIAPSGGDLKNLWENGFKGWCEEQEIARHLMPSKTKFKESLIKWQRNSSYGLDIGKKKSENKINGTLNDPRFNLVCE